MPGRLQVAVNAEIAPHYFGGSESVVMSLIQEMAKIDGGIDQTILAIPKYTKAFEPLLGPHQRVLPWRNRPASIATYPVSRRWAWLRRVMSAEGFKRLVMDYRRLRYGTRLLPQAETPEVLVKNGIDIVHFPTAQCFVTDLPFIYEPHDLQQFHYPEFFSAEEIDYRDRLYGYGCRNARLVVCGTWFTKHDIMHQYDLPPERVAVIPRYSVNARRKLETDEQKELLKELGIDGDFIIFPAMCFPHKNHLRLFEALARLRDETGQEITLVCTGRLYESHFQNLQDRIHNLGLDRQICFTGPLDEKPYTALLHGARFVVFPSLFEGLSQSLMEALAMGKPIVAARQSSIPETVGKAARLHDGEDVDSIAQSLKFALDNPDEMAAIGRKGLAEIHRYNWGRAAQTFVACYKHVAGRQLTGGEECLLARALSPHRPDTD